MCRKRSRDIAIRGLKPVSRNNRRSTLARWCFLCVYEVALATLLNVPVSATMPSPEYLRTEPPRD